MLLKIVTLFISPLNELHALSFYKPLILCKHIVEKSPTPKKHIVEKSPTPKKHIVEKSPTPKKHIVEKSPTPKKHIVEKSPTPKMFGLAWFQISGVQIGYGKKIKGRQKCSLLNCLPHCQHSVWPSNMTKCLSEKPLEQ